MRTRLGLAGGLSALLVLGAVSQAMAAPTTERVSVSSGNAQANGDSGASAL